jgi:hypothetical protein
VSWWHPLQSFDISFGFGFGRDDTHTDTEQEGGEGPGSSTGLSAAVASNSRTPPPQSQPQLELAKNKNKNKYKHKNKNSGLSFAIGPSTVKAAANLCVGRGGQPNLTILPAPAPEGEGEGEGGLVLFLVASVDAAKSVADQLRARGRDARALAKKERQRTEQQRTERQRKAEDDDGKQPRCHAPAGAATPPAPPHAGMTAAAGNSTPSAPPPTPAHLLPCALIWLHGLGDTGEQGGWRSKFTELNARLGKSLVRQHPTAPMVQQITAQPDAGGQGGGTGIHSWFDIHTMPVGLREPQNESGRRYAVGVMRYAVCGMRYVVCGMR